jgi:hypothetical protein
MNLIFSTTIPSIEFLSDVASALLYKIQSFNEEAGTLFESNEVVKLFA